MSEQQTEPQVGDKVEIVSQDSFNGDRGKLDAIVPSLYEYGDDLRENLHYWYHVAFGGLVVPFRRHEVRRVEQEEI